MHDSLQRRLDDHPFFTPHTDPQSGVVSYILSERVAPYQTGLYFMSPSLCGGSEWLWFRIAYPPDRSWRVCAVRLDPEHPEIRTFPHLRMTGNPWIDPTGEVAYVPQADRVVRQHVHGEWKEELRIDSGLVNKRNLFLLATNMSSSCDGRFFLFDSHIGDEFVVWIHDRETGEQRVIHRFVRKMHHSMFSLHDPDLFFISQGPGNDIYTGTRINIECRTWLMDVHANRHEPLTPDLWFGHNAENCHEWWTPSGKIQFCEYRTGIWEADPGSKQRELIWPRPSIHGQCSPDERWISCDENTYKWNDTSPCSVWAMDRSSGKEILIAGNMPQPPFAQRDRRSWHPDPHSHFSADSQALIYTTTVLGTMNLAISPVESWIQIPS
jgi:hypothetical protein